MENCMFSILLNSGNLLSWDSSMGIVLGNIALVNPPQININVGASSTWNWRFGLNDSSLLILGHCHLFIAFWLCWQYSSSFYVKLFVALRLIAAGMRNVTSKSSFKDKVVILESEHKVSKTTVI